MFSLALESLILTTMDNHMYSFNTDIRLQDEGGSIVLLLCCSWFTGAEASSQNSRWLLKTFLNSI